MIVAIVNFHFDVISCKLVYLQIYVHIRFARLFYHPFVSDAVCNCIAICTRFGLNISGFVHLFFLSRPNVVRRCDVYQVPYLSRVLNSCFMYTKVFGLNGIVNRNVNNVLKQCLRKYEILTGLWHNNR